MDDAQLELIAALLRAALDESSSDYQRYLFIDSLKVRVGYCFECGSKLTDYGWGQYCTCQMDD